MKLMIGVVVFICLLSAAVSAQEPGGLQAPKILAPERFDQWGDLRLTDENARLDKIALQAKEWSMSITYLVIHAGQTACVGEAMARGVRARNYLMHQGISPERIVFIDAGWRKKVSVEVWIWPPELGKPKVASDLDLKPGAVRLERNCKSKYRG